MNLERKIRLWKSENRQTARLFNKNEFEIIKGTQWLGAHFIYLRETDSTNIYCKNMSDDQCSAGTVVLTDNQTKGRGQYGKRWISGKNKNLTFTAVFKPNSGNRLTLLTLASAISVKYALQNYTDADIQIKWPNDVIVNGKKIAGLLTECIFNGSEVDRVLIGIGLNVEQKEFGESLQDSVTSLKLLPGRDPSREKLLADILQQMEFMYKRWLKYDSQLHFEINRHMMGCGEWVKLEVNDTEIENEFKFCGINEKGYLVVLTSDLDVKTFTHEQVKISRNTK
jgi:BirA family transcriptional regulator, biotin operon repressor / biotin---[acetyl-CoA-carboxylase] ligase